MTSDDYPYWSEDEWYSSEYADSMSELLEALRREYEANLYKDDDDYPFEVRWDPNV
jgi:hypothetical protein